ncbi:hypothetical protein WR25_10577 [Diploscapter pachys]|uniref:Mitochondrial inner membrane protease subunit n=1 Tax=Diploscapter pachys TaxID=2018661 RepID=A0A2A2JFE5_9BILA|nr:hypothetical protein WR25_10577 [Diploscapter pachys]
MHLLSSRLPAVVFSRSRATYYQSPRKFPPAFVRRFLIRYPRTPIYIVVSLCVMPMLYPWYVGLKLFFTVSREEYEAKRMETKALVYERAAFDECKVRKCRRRNSHGKPIREYRDGPSIRNNSNFCCFQKRMSSLIWKYSKWSALFYCVAHTVSRHIGELVICSGPSMYPTVHDGDLVLAERLSVNAGNLHRGDIVGCLSPQDCNQLLCKRVVCKALDEEGDVVHSELLPNDRVPKGHVFLQYYFTSKLSQVFKNPAILTISSQGDNLVASTDSRHFGPVPEGLVQIRLTLRIWPISRWGWVSNHWFWEKEATRQKRGE